MGPRIVRDRLQVSADPEHGPDAPLDALAVRLVDRIANRLPDAMRAALGSADPLMTPQELAEMLKIDDRTLRRWREKRGTLPPPILIGGAYRWRRADVERWLAAKEPAR